MEYKFRNNKQQCTYFYKVGSTSVRFSISTNDRSKWTTFCQKLGRHATQEDFNNFIDETKIKFVQL